jgi:hypothetical protein
VSKDIVTSFCSGSKGKAGGNRDYFVVSLLAMTRNDNLSNLLDVTFCSDIISAVYFTAETAKAAEKKEKIDSCFRRNDSIKNLCERGMLCGK